MTTIPASSWTIDEVIEDIQLTDPNPSTAVAWGVVGASPDGYIILAADDRDAAERLRRNIRFAQSRIRGRAGCHVVWGAADDVHNYAYANR